MIETVLVNLRERAKGDSELTRLLAQIRTGIGPEMESRAATITRSHRLVVDVGYLQLAIRHASLAAYLLMDVREEEQSVRNFLCEQLGRLLSAKANGQPLASVSAEFHAKDVLSPLQVRLWDDLRGMVAVDVLAWTVLHEVAHRASATCAGYSPAAELCADLWAYKRMRELGYSLWYLAGYLQARTFYEPIELATGLVRADSDHPSFEVRRNQLRDSGLDLLEAPAGDIRSFMLPILSADASGAPVTQLLYLTVNAAPPENQPFLTFATASDGSKGMMAGLRRGRELLLYRRDKQLVEIRISEVHRVGARARITVTHGGTPAQIFDTVALQRNGAPFMALELSGEKLEGMVDIRGLVAVAIDRLRRGGLAPVHVHNLDNIAHTLVAELELMLFDYMRGANEQIQFVERLAVAAQTALARVRSTLGPEGWREVEAIAADDPLFQTFVGIEGKASGGDAEGLGTFLRELSAAGAMPLATGSGR